MIPPMCHCSKCKDRFFFNRYLNHFDSSLTLLDASLLHVGDREPIYGMSSRLLKNDTTVQKAPRLAQINCSLRNAGSGMLNNDKLSCLDCLVAVSEMNKKESVAPLQKNDISEPGNDIKSNFNIKQDKNPGYVLRNGCAAEINRLKGNVDGSPEDNGLFNQVKAGNATNSTNTVNLCTRERVYEIQTQKRYSLPDSTSLSGSLYHSISQFHAQLELRKQSFISEKDSLLNHPKETLGLTKFELLSGSIMGFESTNPIIIPEYSPKTSFGNYYNTKALNPVEIETEMVKVEKSCQVGSETKLVQAKLDKSQYILTENMIILDPHTLQASRYSTNLSKTKSSSSKGFEANQLTLPSSAGPLTIATNISTCISSPNQKSTSKPPERRKRINYHNKIEKRLSKLGNKEDLGLAKKTVFLTPSTVETFVYKITKRYD